MGRSRWIGHAAFARFIDDYQAAGLDRDNRPPPELLEMLKGTARVFSSDLERSTQSARALLPKAEIISSALFTEAPLASPPVPGIRLKAPAWAVISRVAWHGGVKPGIESYGQSKQRARRAEETLIGEAEREGTAVLVAHGYFNAILGRMLRLRGWRRSHGSHRARFWNTVVYERDAAVAPPRARRLDAARLRQLGSRIRRRKAA